MPGGAEAAQVGAGLGGDDLGDGLADAGDGLELVELAGNGRICSSTRDDNSWISADNWSMRCRCSPAQEGVILTEVPGKRVEQLRDLRTHRAFVVSASACTSRSPSINAARH